MSSASGFPTSKKSLSSIIGFTNDQTQTKAQFNTLQSSGSDRVSLDTVQRALYAVSTSKVVDSATKRTVLCTGIAAKKDDVIRFTSGVLSGMDFPVLSAPDANTIVIGSEFDTAPSAADTFDLFRYTFVKVGADGAQSVSVDIKHNGANPSSIRLGDGTTEVGVTLANELKVSDANLLTELQKANAVLTTGDVADYTFDNLTGQTLFTGIAKKIRIVQNGGEMLDIYKNAVKIGALEAGGKIEFPISMIVTDALIVKSKAGTVTTNICWNIFA